MCIDINKYYVNCLLLLFVLIFSIYINRYFFIFNKYVASIFNIFSTSNQFQYLILKET